MKTNKWLERTLIVPEMNPKLLPPERLFYWLATPRNPVFASPNPMVKMFIEAMLAGEKTEFFYIGGSTPGLGRIVTPSLVFQHKTEGPIYVAGFCHIRKANRIFAIEKTMVILSRN